MPKQAFRVLPDKAKNIWILQALAETTLAVNGVKLIAAGKGKTEGNFHSSIYLHPEAANEVVVDALEIQIWTVRDAELAANKSFEDVPTMAEYFAKKLEIVDGTATLVDPTVAVKNMDQAVTNVKPKAKDNLRYVLEKGGFGDFLVVIHSFSGKRLLGKFYDLEKAGENAKCERNLRVMARLDMPDDPAILKILDECVISNFRVILTNTPERWAELSEYLKMMDFHTWSKDDRTLAANHFCRAIMTALEKLHAKRITMGELLPQHIAIHHLTVSGAKVFLISLSKVKKHSTANKAFEKACLKDTKEAVRAMRLIMMYPDLLVAAHFQHTEGIVSQPGPVKRSNLGKHDEQPAKKRKTDGEPEYSGSDHPYVGVPENPDAAWHLKKAQDDLKEAEDKWNKYKLAKEYDPLSHIDSVLGTAVYNAKRRVVKFKKEVQKEATKRALDIAGGWTMPLNTSHRRVYYNKVTNEVSETMPPVADYLRKVKLSAEHPALEENRTDEKPEHCQNVLVQDSYAYRQPLEDVDGNYSFGYPILDAIFRDFGTLTWDWTAKEIIRQIRVAEGECSDPWRTLDVVKSWKVHAKDSPDGDVLVDMKDLGTFFGFILQIWPTWGKTLQTKAKAYIDKVKNPDFCLGKDLRALARDLASLGNMPSQLADAFKTLLNCKIGNFFELNNTFKLWYHVPSSMFNGTQLLSMADKGPYERCKESSFRPPFQQVRGDPKLEGHYISIDLLPKLAKELEMEVVGTPAEPSERTVDAADFSIVDSRRSMILVKKTSLRWAELDRITRNINFQLHGKLREVTQAHLEGYFFNKEAKIPDNVDRPEHWYDFNLRKYPFASYITNTDTADEEAYSTPSQSVTPVVDEMLKKQLQKQALSRIGPWLKSTRERRIPSKLRRTPVEPRRTPVEPRRYPVEPFCDPVEPHPVDDSQVGHQQEIVEQEASSSSQRTVKAPEPKQVKEGAWQADDFWVDSAVAEEDDEGWETDDESDWETITDDDDNEVRFDNQDMVFVVVDKDNGIGMNHHSAAGLDSLQGWRMIPQPQESDGEDYMKSNPSYTYPEYDPNGCIIFCQDRQDIWDCTFGRDHEDDFLLPYNEQGVKVMPQIAFRIVPSKKHNLWMVQALSKQFIRLNDSSGGDQGPSLDSAGGDSLFWKTAEVPAAVDLFAKKLQVKGSIGTPTADQRSMREIPNVNTYQLKRYILDKNPISPLTMKIVNLFTGEVYAGIFFNQDHDETLEMSLLRCIGKQPSILAYTGEIQIDSNRVFLSSAHDAYLPLDVYMERMNFETRTHEQEKIAQPQQVTCFENWFTLWKFLPSSESFMEASIQGQYEFIISMFDAASDEFLAPSKEEARKVLQVVRFCAAYAKLKAVAVGQFLPDIAPLSRDYGVGDTMPPPASTGTRPNETEKGFYAAEEAHELAKMKWLTYKRNPGYTPLNGKDRRLAMAQEAASQSKKDEDLRPGWRHFMDANGGPVHVHLERQVIPSVYPEALYMGGENSARGPESGDASLAFHISSNRKVIRVFGTHRAHR
ncbi:uncharacterized protein BDZ99DRAFT_527318 [Mytilinidion resinicola]|uniref:Uncharacterized protein n=1 Tax=Mytilinidion resinicola TaxID=574789 RepID=A0A6A6Y1R1_9PEZI|nr:uncharacterized protein BDZ99DRAFT_527318 [Mytilinidion resinicola]KAF2802590.1 hypothetical protein BDZ99DRAFT_527318 [Mytilinidion resinicola]